MRLRKQAFDEYPHRDDSRDGTISAKAISHAEMSNDKSTKYNATGGKIMADRIRQYMKYIDQLLESEEEMDWEEEMKKHLVQIAFFAHERMIHLIVTVTFAILTVLIILYTFDHFSIPMALLIILFMGLMIPYIRHYFLLENSVQDMYEQYDKMQAKAGKASFVRVGKYKR